MAKSKVRLQGGLHDQFFRENFSRPERLAEFLSLYLPPQLAERLDLTTVEILNDSFVDEELKKHQSDLLCRVFFKDGSSIFVYVLIEHKSHPVWWVALQLLRYMVRIWERIPMRKRQKLPVVFPLVFYHGKRRWTIARQFSALFDTAAAELIRPHLPDFEYFLLDLSANSKTEIKGKAELKAALTALHGIFDEAAVDWIVEIALLMQNHPEQIEMLKKVLIYFAQARDLSPANVRQALQRSVRDPKRRKEIEMNYVEQLREEGRVEGLEKGREEGREEGALRLLFRQLGRRFGTLGVKLQKEISALTLPQIEQLGEAMLDFQTRRELSAWLKQQRGQ